jgi:acetyl-CoA carboxylase biotin carboxyl carrier protein
MDEQRTMVPEEAVAEPQAGVAVPAQEAVAAPEGDGAVSEGAGAAAGERLAAEPQPDPAAHHSLDGGDASLLALIDRLTTLLERSDLAELEVESGSTSVILRKASAIPAQAVVVAAGRGDAPADPATPGPIADGPHPAHAAPGLERKAVVAPLTGIYYAAPSPGSAPYVKIGSEVAVGQVIGLIEAMKLFNEIKSDAAGRVSHIAAENGQLIKAKQPIIEVEPL